MCSFLPTVLFHLAFARWILFSFGFHLAVQTKFDIVPMKNPDKNASIVTNNNITKILQFNNITIILLTTVSAPITFVTDQMLM